MPSSIDNAHEVAPSSKVQAALLVRLCRGNRPLSELARNLETSWPSASRLEDPPPLAQLEAVGPCRKRIREAVGNII
ncbi:MAG: hypothetical protein V1844_06155 [Pseudomonadota bacterium]